MEDRGRSPKGEAELLRERIETLITAVEKVTFPILRGDRRFTDAEKIIEHFNHHVGIWRDGGQLRPVIEDINELAAAVAILRLGDEGLTLLYEPGLARTQKKIDFCILWPDGTRSWLEIKTIAPLWIDDEASWARFEAIAAEYPETAQFLVQREWLGAAIFGQEIKARWSFVRYVRQVEETAALLTDAERGPVRLIFCSNGAFRDDGLEDFADFYRSGRFRLDDWSRNAVPRFMADEEISLRHSLAGLCYLERDHAQPLASDFRLDMRGPDFGI